jgi:transposase, IS5 family
MSLYIFFLYFLVFITIKKTSIHRSLNLQIPIPKEAIQYLIYAGVSTTDRPAISPRIVLGSLIIKHLGKFADRETVEQILENMYKQYFLGFSSFTSAPPFDPSLFVEFKKLLGMDNLNAINEKIVALKTRLETSKNDSKPSDSDQKPPENNNDSENRGRVIFDTTAFPQDIAYPTDLNLLSDGREKSEYLIDILYDPSNMKKSQGLSAWLPADTTYT